MNIIEMYSHLTSGPVPEVLREAHQRASALPKELPAEFEDLPQVLSDKDFFDSRCGEYPICALSKTVEQEWGPYRVASAGGYLNTVSGAVSLQIRHRRVRDWSNDQHRRVPQGVDYRWYYRPDRPLVQFRVKVKVYELEPNGMYHFSLYTL